MREKKSGQADGSPGELILSKECVIVYDNGNNAAKCFNYTVQKFHYGWNFQKDKNLSVYNNTACIKDTEEQSSDNTGIQNKGKTEIDSLNKRNFKIWAGDFSLTRLNHWLIRIRAINTKQNKAKIISPIGKRKIERYSMQWTFISFGFDAKLNQHRYLNH